MAEFLNRIRTPDKRVPLRQAALHTLLIACAGLASGVIIQWLDLHTSTLGNILSQTSVWIFLCTVISVLSSTPFRAAIHVFLFCMGMLPTYYLTAALTSSFYAISYAYGWTAFALLTPFLGLCVWYAKGKTFVSKIISVGVVLVMLATAVILYDRIRMADMLLAALTSMVLFKKQPFPSDVR